MDPQPPSPSRNEQGQFINGHIGGPGRPRGSRNKLGEEFCIALYEDFQKHGVAVIEAVRTERPADYLKLVASLVPRQIDLQSGDETFIDKDKAISVLDEMIAQVNREAAERDAERALHSNGSS
jgi:hypothetical protein